MASGRLCDYRRVYPIEQGLGFDSWPKWKPAYCKLIWNFRIRECNKTPATPVITGNIGY